MKNLKIRNTKISIYNFKSVHLHFGINFDFLNDGFSLVIRTTHYLINIRRSK